MEECRPLVDEWNELYEKWNASSKGSREVAEKIDMSPEDLKRLEDLDKQGNQARRSWDHTLQKRGRRYAECAFENYAIECDSQKSAVESLTAYAKDSIAQVAVGRNVILFGPRGSGKDHLLMATARMVARWSLSSVRWVNGVDLMEHFRCEVTGKYSDLESIMAAKIDGVDCLWISDPLPPSGALSEFQQTQMFQLLDARYSAMLPTWVSVNCSSGAELESRIGAQSADRLRHGALAIHCDWPSYRTGE